MTHPPCPCQLSPAEQDTHAALVEQRDRLAAEVARLNAELETLSALAQHYIWSAWIQAKRAERAEKRLRDLGKVAK